jgi:cytochrome c oxidase assembly protein subunit 15
VASHLLVGNSFCATLLVLGLLLGEREEPASRAPIGWMVRVVSAALAVGVLGQLVLGGFVSSSFAGLACGTWPACNGSSWFPTLSGLVGLQVGHRLLAYTLLVLAVAAAAATRFAGRAGRASAVVLTAVVVQASLGIANELLRIPVEITLLHSAGAAAVALSTTWLIVEVWWSPFPAKEGRVVASARPAHAVEIG